MIKVRKNPWRLARKSLLIVMAALAIVAIVLGVFWFINRDTNPIPEDIQNVLTFSPLIIPTDSERFDSINYRLTRGEDDTQILSYTILFEGKEVAFSSYIQPPQFTEIPEYKDRFLSNIVLQNGTVPTANGTIYLGQLSKQDNKQIGVMLEYGLLVFMQPSETLDEATWRRLGEAFSIARSN